MMISGRTPTLSLPAALALGLLCSLTPCRGEEDPFTSPDLEAAGSFPLRFSADPMLASWYIPGAAHYARVYEREEDQEIEWSVSRWPGASGETCITDRDVLEDLDPPLPTPPGGRMPHNGGQELLPAYAGILGMWRHANHLAIVSNQLAHHIMGPWPDGEGDFAGDFYRGPYPGTYPGPDSGPRFYANWPSAERFEFWLRLDRVGTDTPGTGSLWDRRTHLIRMGIWVDGVPIFNVLDGKHYDPSPTATSEGPGDVNGMIDSCGQLIGNPTWNANAGETEAHTFDVTSGHPQGQGIYHRHLSPAKLRHTLGDNIRYDDETHSFKEDTRALMHSPILGWACDGYPVYGPYGYANPCDDGSEVVAVRSGYRERSGLGRRTSLPLWAARLQGIPIPPGSTEALLKMEDFGPDVMAPFELGHYIEDYEFVGDLGLSQTECPEPSETFVPGDYDLDEHNGRWCVTPEYPNGTYAYFCTIDENGAPAFPYVLGPTYYGDPDCCPEDRGDPADGEKLYELADQFDLARNAGVARGIGQFGEEKIEFRWWVTEGAQYRPWITEDLVEWRPDPYVLVPPGALLRYERPLAGNGREFVRLESLGTFEPYDDGIPRIVPDRGLRGTMVGATITLDMNYADQIPPGPVFETAAQIGQVPGQDVVRDDRVVTARFALPPQMPPGPKTVTVVIQTSLQPVVYQFEAAFRVLGDANQ